MEKYEKLFKGLEMCAGPDCSTDCPYHGETRGGKTCRAWLLLDASIAINNEQALHESADEGLQNAVEELGKLSEERDNLRKQVEELEGEKKSEPGLAETMECALKATMQAEYWRGQTDALKWCLHDRFDGVTVEDVVDVELPEAEADSHD